jgi:hypothetical protein
MSRSNINTFSIETARGVRSFHLHQGDICDSNDDVIVVSSHANADLPPSGAALRAVRDRFGYDFSTIDPLMVLRPNVGTFLLRDERAAGRTVLVVRIPGARSAAGEGSEPIEAFKESLWTLFGSLSALEFKGGRSLRSISLPILAKSRGFDVRDLLTVLLDAVIRWLRFSQTTEEVSLFILQPLDFSQWYEEMDRLLGRQYFESARDSILGGLRQELLALVRHARCQSNDNRTTEWLDPLAVALAEDKLKFQSIAAEGRKLAEYMARFYLAKVGMTSKGHLYEKIKTIRDSKKIAPWVTNYLMSLKDFGNEEVHISSESGYQPNRVSHEDLLALLCSISRLVQIWLGWDTGSGVETDHSAVKQN